MRARLRKYLRISLRGMLVFTGVLCCMFAWIGIRYHCHTVEQALLKECDVRVFRDKYCGPPFLRKSLGRFEIFRHAVDIAIPDSESSIDWDEFFVMFQDVECLDIGSSNMTDSSLRGIRKCGQLKEFSIWGDQFSENVVRLIAECKTIELLSLESFTLSRESLQRISRLPNIDEVHLMDCSFDDSNDLGVLLESETLTFLDIRQTYVNDAIVKRLMHERPNLIVLYGP